MVPSKSRRTPDRHRRGQAPHGARGVETLAAAGGPTSASGNGGRCARTTARMATAWSYIGHDDHARSRAYRWGEDGIAGWSDAGNAAGASALVVVEWGTGPDPEGALVRPDQLRRQSRRGREGGCTIYLDARADAHAYLRMLYKYPQRAFPYEASSLEGESGARQDGSRNSTLLDTGAFDDAIAISMSISNTPRRIRTILCSASPSTNRGGGGAAASCCRSTLVRANVWSWMTEQDQHAAAEPAWPATAAGDAIEARRRSGNSCCTVRRRQRSRCSARTTPTPCSACLGLCQ